MYYAKRPSPVTCAAAGGIFTVGVVSLIARAMHTFTTFTLAPPFDWILYITSVVGVIGGGSFSTWLLVRNYRSHIAGLQAENAELRAHRDKLDAILQAVKDADAQGEINGVRLAKLLKLHQQQLSDADTQAIPRPGLRSINGGGERLIP